MAKKYEFETFNFGVPGFEEIFKGGIRKNSSIILSGDPGTGKSIAALQFISAGAKAGEAGLYITSEETVDSLKAYCEELGLDDISTQIDKGKITILEQKVTSGRIISLEAPLKLIQQKKIKRVVIDSLTLFEYIYSSNVEEFRKGIIRFLIEMKESGITLVATSDRSSTNMDLIEYKAEDFLFEGLIILSKIRKGASFERILTVAKMRGQDYKMGIFPFTIQRGGIKVHVKELPYSLIEQDTMKGR